MLSKGISVEAWPFFDNTLNCVMFNSYITKKFIINKNTIKVLNIGKDLFSCCTFSWLEQQTTFSWTMLCIDRYFNYVIYRQTFNWLKMFSWNLLRFPIVNFWPFMVKRSRIFWALPWLPSWKPCIINKDSTTQTKRTLVVWQHEFCDKVQFHIVKHFDHMLSRQVKLVIFKLPK